MRRSRNSGRRSSSGQAGEFDRSFAGYVSSLRSSPGFGVRVAAGAAFGLALILQKGFLVFLLAVLGVLALAVLVIYPLYRRHGPGPF